MRQILQNFAPTEQHLDHYKEKKFEFIYRERKPFQILNENILLKNIHQNKQPLQNSQKLNGDVNILRENNIFTV